MKYRYMHVKLFSTKFADSLRSSGLEQSRNSLMHTKLSTLCAGAIMGDLSTLLLLSQPVKLYSTTVVCKALYIALQCL